MNDTEIELLRCDVKALEDVVEQLRKIVDAREADLGRMHGETSAEIGRLREALRQIELNSRDGPPLMAKLNWLARTTLSQNRSK